MSVGDSALELPPAVLEFLARQQTLTLATASPAAVPHASTLLYVNEGPTLYFWARATTLTARQVQQNPVVAFTIDAAAEDLNQTQGVQGIGECSVLLVGERIARVAALFGEKFPALTPGSTMSISFFRITPTELEFIDNTTSGASSAAGTFGAEFHRERSYSVITNLPREAVNTVIASLQHSVVPAGELIARQGTPADKFFILVEGEAEVLRDGHRLDSLGPGQLFGEVSIMRDHPRSATVQAKTDTKLLALERDTFRDLIARSMEITPDFDRVIRARLDAQGAG
jgi:CRP-like cAMP-binding protein